MLIQNKQVFVENGVTHIVCEKCGRSKKISNLVSSNFHSSVLVTCGCGYRFKVIFNFRRHYRKSTSLRGVFRISSGGYSYPMIVENISLGGIGFRSPFVDKIKIGDVIEVEFGLDDQHNSLIKRCCTVKHVYQGHVGCEFLCDRAYDKKIWFYLYPSSNSQRKEFD